jgi:predicted nucleotidyltransferase
MRRSDILQTLRQNRDELAQRHGIRSLALFGSAARDEATESSDVDLLVEFDRPVGLFHLIGAQQYLERLLGVRKVDLVLRHSVIDELRDDILHEAIDVFSAPQMEVSPAAHAGGD